MLTDKSENFVETWKFLDRRIRDILEYGKHINLVCSFYNKLFIRKLRNFASGVNVGLNSLISLMSMYPNKFENDIEELKARNYDQKRHSSYESQTTIKEDFQALNERHRNGKIDQQSER